MSLWKGKKLTTVLRDTATFVIRSVTPFDQGSREGSAFENVIEQDSVERQILPRSKSRTFGPVSTDRYISYRPTFLKGSQPEIL